MLLFDSIRTLSVRNGAQLCQGFALLALHIGSTQHHSSSLYGVRYCAREVGGPGLTWSRVAHLRPRCVGVRSGLCPVGKAADQCYIMRRTPDAGRQAERGFS